MSNYYNFFGVRSFFLEGGRGVVLFISKLIVGNYTFTCLPDIIMLCYHIYHSLLLYNTITLVDDQGGYKFITIEQN